MSQNQIKKENDQTLAPDELLDKTLYLMLQLTEDELSDFVEWLKTVKGV